MALSKSTIVVSGEVGDLAKACIVGITTQVALGTFVTAYMALSDGGLESTHFSERVVTEGTPAALSNSDRRADCYFQDVDTGSVVSLTLIAPKASAVELVPGRDGGERVTDVAMASLKTALETATGRSLKALYGYIVQKK